MNDSEIREKYGLNGKKHGLVLFIQMILVIGRIQISDNCCSGSRYCYRRDGFDYPFYTSGYYSFR